MALLFSNGSSSKEMLFEANMCREKTAKKVNMHGTQGGSFNVKVKIVDLNGTHHKYRIKVTDKK